MKTAFLNAPVGAKLSKSKKSKRKLTDDDTVRQYLFDNVLLKVKTTVEEEAWEDFWLVAIGSPTRVTQEIDRLHVLGYAERIAWSPPVTLPTGDVVSLMTRRRSHR